MENRNVPIHDENIAGTRTLSPEELQNQHKDSKRNCLLRFSAWVSLQNLDPKREMSQMYVGNS